MPLERGAPRALARRTAAEGGRRSTHHPARDRDCEKPFHHDRNVDATAVKELVWPAIVSRGPTQHRDERR
ncbi:MAG TPA: hypothetical protein VLV78_14030 [Thermoanaerobaculia bacterium]|nr:hypothetical protein [Thermoanaerobaculia bacterium]